MINNLMIYALLIFIATPSFAKWNCEGAYQQYTNFFHGEEYEITDHMKVKTKANKLTNAIKAIENKFEVYVDTVDACGFRFLNLDALESPRPSFSWLIKEVYNAETTKSEKTYSPDLKITPSQVKEESNKRMLEDQSLAKAYASDEKTSKEDLSDEYFVNDDMYTDLIFTSICAYACTQR